MTYPESHLDLLQLPAAIALSTLTEDGAIQTTAVWYLLDDDGVLRISVNDNRAKIKHLQANDTVNLFLIDPENQFRTLEIRGTAELSKDEDYAVRSKVGAKYGADMAKFDQPGDVRWTISVHPEKVVAR